MADPERDPYLNDPNIRRAASLQIVFGGALGAGLGWAIGGWLELPLVACIPAGIVIGWALAQVLLVTYGGRSTR